MKSQSKLCNAAFVGLLLASLAASCFAQQSGLRDAEFRAFYSGFTAAVKANDKNKIADLIEFPVKDWSIERKGNVETIPIKDKAEFLAKYDLFFTPFMRSHALKAEPKKASDNHYTLIWDDANAEFSFEFEYGQDHSFRVTAFLIGPR